MSKFLIDILLATAPLLSTYFYCRSNRRTAAYNVHHRLVFYLYDPLCLLKHHASIVLQWRQCCWTVQPRVGLLNEYHHFVYSRLHLCSTMILWHQFCSSLLHVGVLPNQTYPHYQPALQHLSFSFTSLTSPSLAAKVKRRMSSSSIYRREMEITIKQFDVWEILMRLWMFHLIETIHHLISFKQ